MQTQTAGRREWTALAVLCLPLLIVSMDVSVLFFAVPRISDTLRPSATQLLWILDVYGFVLAGLLLTMGKVADRIGRRRLLLLGAAAFGGASLLAATAPSAGWLIGARALLGLAGSTLMPSTLALIRNVFTDAAARAKAVGIWSAVLAAGAGAGPVVAGLLLTRFSWGSVFVINVPVMVVLLLVAPRLVPESRDGAARVDVLSAVLSLVAVLPVVQAVKSWAVDGWSGSVALLGFVGAAAALGFLRRQRTLVSPMVDLDLFRVRGFGASVAIQVIGMFGVMGNAVLMTQYLQSVLGYSALAAALWSLVPSVVVGGAVPAATAVAARLGRPRVMALGFLAAAAGFVVMLGAGPHSSVAVALVGAGLVAAGLVSVATLVTEYAIGIAPAERAGAVSALVETANELGGALGMALLGSVLAAVYAARIRHLLPAGLGHDVAARASEGVGGAVLAGEQLGGAVGHTVAAAARSAYVSGMHVTDVVAAGVLLVGALVSVVALPSRERLDVSGDPAAAGRRTA